MSDAPAADDGGPFEEQRRIYELLSQETRHLVLQYVLGHPSHLPSLDELAYVIPKNRAAIRDQLEVLREAGILARYDHPPNESSRDLPSQFYGLTEYGIEVLAEYNYLRGLPIARAVYDNTRLSEKAERHRDAPRPDLPPAVERALAIDDADGADDERIARVVRERTAETHSVEEQVEVVRAFHEAGIGPDHEGITVTEIEDELGLDTGFQLRTVLGTLVDVELIERTVPPGPGIFLISERTDEVVDGRVTEEAERNLEALVAHVYDELHAAELEEDPTETDGKRVVTSGRPVAVGDGSGRTVRGILAAELDVRPEDVVGYLRSGDPVERLDAAVEAIESSEEVTKSEEYGRILFVNQAYRYRLTERALELL